MARRYTIPCSLPNTNTVYIALDGGRQACREGGREGAREYYGWEGGSKGRVGRMGEDGSEVREPGSDDVAEGGSESGGMEGGLRKGTSDEGT